MQLYFSQRRCGVKKKLRMSSLALAAATASSPPSTNNSSGWRSSPLGHTYKKFEAEWNAAGSNKTRASQYGAGADGGQARIIYFIERTRQLEVELEQTNAKMQAKTKKERRHQSDIADLRQLVNDLCAKIRKVERERDSSVKEKTAAQVEATQMGARLKTVQLDARKFKHADSRMHTMLVNANREAQEQKLRAENLEDALEMARKKSEDAVADASARVFTIESQTAESLAAANHRAEEVLEELRGIQGGWQEMKNRADASQQREDAALKNAEARIAMAENGARTAKGATKEATTVKIAAEKETAELRAQVAGLQHAVSSRTNEVEELRRENSRLEASYQQQQKEMTNLQASLHQTERSLRDENRQQRVQHIKFIDRRIAVKKEKEETKKHPPKKRPSKQKVEQTKRAEERAKQRAEHKKKIKERQRLLHKH